MRNCHGADTPLLSRYRPPLLFSSFHILHHLQRPEQVLTYFRSLIWYTLLSSSRGFGGHWFLSQHHSWVFLSISRGAVSLIFSHASTSPIFRPAWWQKNPCWLSALQQRCIFMGCAAWPSHWTTKACMTEGHGLPRGSNTCESALFSCRYDLRQSLFPSLWNKYIFHIYIPVVYRAVDIIFCSSVCLLIYRRACQRDKGNAMYAQNCALAYAHARDIPQASVYAHRWLLFCCLLLLLLLLLLMVVTVVLSLRLQSSP